jgi:NAD(P)-dependent dehydrogenase (short-subunit alcohol dehydrogenase family)
MPRADRTLPRMPVQTALVTGSTDGHGRHVALDLARRGWRVLFHGRDAERGEQVLGEAGSGDHELLLADLGSKAEVRRLVADALERDVQLLVNNAGIWIGERSESADGIELTFAVNHLAHVILTEELIAGGAPVRRVVNVASIGQAAFDWDDPLLERSYDGYQAYAQSKLAQVAFTFDLAEPFGRRDITIDALHPSTFMDTAMVRRVGRPRSTVEEGAAATLRLIEDDGGSGRFFDGTREARAHPAAYDAQERERIHQLTAGLLE